MGKSLDTLNFLLLGKNRRRVAAWEASQAIVYRKSISVLRHGTALKRKEKSRRDLKPLRYATPHISIDAHPRNARCREVSGYSTSDDLCATWFVELAL